jgi:hypothetical protein
MSSLRRACALAGRQIFPSFHNAADYGTRYIKTILALIARSRARKIMQSAPCIRSLSPESRVYNLCPPLSDESRLSLSPLGALSLPSDSFKNLHALLFQSLWRCASCRIHSTDVRCTAFSCNHEPLRGAHDTIMRVAPHHADRPSPSRMVWTLLACGRLFHSPRPCLLITSRSELSWFCRFGFPIFTMTSRDTILHLHLISPSSPVTHTQSAPTTRCVTPSRCSSRHTLPFGRRCRQVRQRTATWRSVDCGLCSPA